jgi:hypothetical protein
MQTTKQVAKVVGATIVYSLMVTTLFGLAVNGAKEAKTFSHQLFKL